MKLAINPLVCVCIPTYNSALTLSETLDSILGQSYKNLQVCIVDNASTDDTCEIAESYSKHDSRIRVVRYYENIGAEGNFTRCLGLACGEYTAIFHSDDIYTPIMVEELVSFLEAHQEAGAVFSMAQSLDADCQLGRVYRLPPELRRTSSALYSFDEIFRALLKYGNFFFCPGVIARTSVYRDYIRVWDVSGFKTSSDLDVWLRILRKAPVGIIDKPLLHYRGAAVSSFSYTAARKKTVPADMFGVFDVYINGYASYLMGENERADYSLLVLKDDINRAFNLFSIGESASGRILLRGLFDSGNFIHALWSVFHLKAILYGYIVYLLSWLPLSEKVRCAICRRRFGG